VVELFAVLNDQYVSGDQVSAELWLKKSGGVNFKYKRIMEVINQFAGINAPGIAQHLGLSLRSTQRYLRQLTANGQISFKGAPKSGGYYKVEKS